MAVTAAGYVQGLESARSRQLCDDLRQIPGVGEQVQFPQIVVTGDTSSGKSSILSALSGFEFPAASDVCTRCPIELQLTRSDSDFKATISLAVDVASAAATVASEEKKADQQDAEAETLSSKDSFRDAIGKWMARAVEGSPGGFSKTRVVVKASGRDLPSLTLIDLPGIVRSGVEDSVVTFVRNMLQFYIEQKRTVILAVMTSNSAMENQEIYRLATKADPDGVRTLGVLSKCDALERLDDTARQILSNQKFALKLGWAGVKCRDRADREKMSVMDGLVAEEKFFREDEPWKQLPQNLLGCNNLRSRLSELLHERITDQLPSVCTEIEARLTAQRAELKGLGPHLNSAEARRAFFDSTLRSLVSMVATAASGQYTRDAFFTEYADDLEASNRWRAMVASKLKAFDEQVRALSVCEKTVDQKSLKLDEIVTILRDDGFNREGWSQASVDHVKAGNSYSPIFSPFVFDIADGLQQFRGSELPGFLSFPLFQRLFDSVVVTKWASPAEGLADEVFKSGLEMAKRAVDAACEKQHGKFAAFLARCVETSAKQLCAEYEASVQVTLQDERTPSTQNHYFFETVQQLRAEPLKKAVEALQADAKGLVNKDAVLALLRTHSTKSNVEHEVAAKRFIDVIEQKTIKFVDAFAQGIQTASSKQSTDKGLEVLFAEPVAIAQQRKRLSAGIAALEEAAEKISAARSGF